MQTIKNHFTKMNISTRVVDSTITFTFGDAGENHTGMQMVGEKLSAGLGFTTDNLQKIKENLEGWGSICELYRLNELVNDDILDELGVRDLMMLHY